MLIDTVRQYRRERLKRQRLAKSLQELRRSFGRAFSVKRIKRYQFLSQTTDAEPLDLKAIEMILLSDRDSVRNHRDSAGFVLSANEAIDEKVSPKAIASLCKTYPDCLDEKWTFGDVGQMDRELRYGEPIQEADIKAAESR